jgi:hypothetical protein
MKRYKVYAGYQQFYVADAALDPAAPEVWADDHIQQRHNTLQHITALCTVGDISARVISCGPVDARPQLEDEADFEVVITIEVPSGTVGVYGWPWEPMDQYQITPGQCRIRFTGYRTDQAESEEDYYLVEIKEAEPEN